MIPSTQITLAQNALTLLSGQPLSVSKTHMVIVIHMCGLMSSFFMLRDVLFEQKPEKILDTAAAHRVLMRWKNDPSFWQEAPKRGVCVQLFNVLQVVSILNSPVCAKMIICASIKWSFICTLRLCSHMHNILEIFCCQASLQIG